MATEISNETYNSLGRYLYSALRYIRALDGVNRMNISNFELVAGVEDSAQTYMTTALRFISLASFEMAYLYY